MQGHTPPLGNHLAQGLFDQRGCVGCALAAGPILLLVLLEYENIMQVFSRTNRLLAI